MKSLEKYTLEFFDSVVVIPRLKISAVFDFMYSKMVEREDRLKAKLLEKIEPLKHRNKKGNTSYYISRLETLEECLKMIEEQDDGI